MIRHIVMFSMLEEYEGKSRHKKFEPVFFEHNTLTPFLSFFWLMWASFYGVLQELAVAYSFACFKQGIRCAP